ncbi:MAG: [protein-PII] uridylyltransferase [Rhodobacteraceae bacterium]|nr:[protein-PII] uridylyltransferase [Paracoccaceae bacterium]
MAGEDAVNAGMQIDNLLLPAGDIFDEAGMAEFINRAAAGPGDLRTEVLAELRTRRNNAIEAIQSEALKQFPVNPFAAKKTVRTYAYLSDGIVRSTLKLAVEHLGSASGTPIAFAVGAVGGYGRAEMAEHSDLDLLFLVEDNIDPWIETVIETVLYLLWDLKLKVGHSCRNAKDCIRLGREDYTIRTALLEFRPVYGDEKLAENLKLRLWKELFEGTGRDFVEAKLAEREQRNERQNGNRYLLEPNVKEGKGGLRDLQTLFWIVKYLYRVDDPRDLIALGVYTVEEFEKFFSAEAFLWSVRCVLHILSGKAQDKLYFEVQADVAAALGFEASESRTAVEYFMQEYFRHATDVGELTRVFLTALEARHVKREPKVLGFLRNTGFGLGIKVGKAYAIQHGRLAIADNEGFLSDPLNIMKLFEEALRTGLLVHPDAMRLIASNLHLIDDKFRQDSEISRYFFDLLLNHGNPARALRRMNELGVLGRYLPEFQNIVAMIQPGGYHHYTVDEHTIQCITTLSQIERGEYREELPVASEILEKGINRKVLYLALLLHDVGKGSGQDHSVRGAELARVVAERLGLAEDEAGTVEWLVRNHLLMSDTCQKRDISDSRTVRNFANIVASRTRLKLLTVLTVCDIRGVGPGVWTNWKAQLLRDLYRMSHISLTEGRGADSPAAAGEAKDRFQEQVSGADPDRIAFEIKRHSDTYWQGLNTETHLAFFKLLEDLSEGEIRLDTKLDPDRDATRVCIAMADHPGMFSRTAGAIALAAANVVDAKTFTSTDGYATAVFWLQDQRGRPYGRSRFKRLAQTLERSMKGELDTAKALEERERQLQSTIAARRVRSFVVPTEITFDNEGSDIHTIIEVDTRDRPGLMFDIAYTLFRSNVTIASAVIATYGVQAVDVFYVKDSAGLKLYSESRQQSLRSKLMQRIGNAPDR